MESYKRRVNMERLPWNPKKPLVGRWYWALVDQQGQHYFPKVEGEIRRLYTVPGGQPDCFYLESLLESTEEIG